MKQNSGGLSLPILMVDQRESPENIGLVIQVMDGIKDWTVERDVLPVGDFAVGGVLGIEHKTPEDFLGSLNGRLESQLIELARNFTVPVLLIDGELGEVLWSKYNSYPPAFIMAYLARLINGMTDEDDVEKIYRITPFFCGRGGNIKRLPHVVKWLALKTAPSTTKYQAVRGKAPISDQRIRLIASLPGIGRERASRILEKFGSPGKAFASLDQWTEIEGIGNATLEKVRKVVAE